MNALAIVISLSMTQLQLVDRSVVPEKVLVSYSISYGSINKRGKSTSPAGAFHVKRKAKIGPPDTEPKYGTRLLQLNYKYATGRHFCIHGTDRPELIGQAVSDGCIRLKNADVEDLYGRVPVGTPVEVRL